MKLVIICCVKHAEKMQALPDLIVLTGRCIFSLKKYGISCNFVLSQLSLEIVVNGGYYTYIFDVWCVVVAVVDAELSLIGMLDFSQFAI